jgi:hypothetical protein
MVAAYAGRVAYTYYSQNDRTMATMNHLVNQQFLQQNSPLQHLLLPVVVVLPGLV